jgi:hypothetical protein
MCAQYFDVIQEGDLIQLRGYSVSVDVAGDASNPSDLFFFEHESPGEVFHVPSELPSHNVNYTHGVVLLILLLS